MEHEEKRIYLIKWLLSENRQYAGMDIPAGETEQRQLLRGLMNIRMPGDADEGFLKVQDEYLQEVRHQKGDVSVEELEEDEPGMILWKGDITRLQCDAIVNAANSGMTGCYRPNHNCIDNCIHTYAGIQLRKKCADIMEAQGYEEPAGQAKITPGYNLPARHVIHTVGPIVQGNLTKEHEELLGSCYRSCLEIAAEDDLRSIAFCCISTGVFLFPQRRAAEIAVRTVRDFLKNGTSVKKVIFNVFRDTDEAIYRSLLG